MLTLAIGPHHISSYEGICPESYDVHRIFWYLLLKMRVPWFSSRFSHRRPMACTLRHAALELPLSLYPNSFVSEGSGFCQNERKICPMVSLVRKMEWPALGGMGLLCVRSGCFTHSLLHLCVQYPPMGLSCVAWFWAFTYIASSSWILLSCPLRVSTSYVMFFFWEPFLATISCGRCPTLCSPNTKNSLRSFLYSVSSRERVVGTQCLFVKWIIE